MHKLIDMSGQRFGRLTVIRREGSRNKRALWHCICDCGNEITVIGKNLRNGNTKSCGCIQREKAASRLTTHGMRRTRLYKIWAGIKARCLRETEPGYIHYGGRGISVCEEWKNSFEAFRDWALSHGYSDDLSIDRIDVNGNYCPENCRWATDEEQKNNMRSNRKLTFNGETHTLAEWGRITGFGRNNIVNRLKLLNWPVERILTEPVHKQNKAR